MQRSFFGTLARHQVGSLVATIVDFLTMIALVSGAGVAPWYATAVGAACGGAANFFLGRIWIFDARAANRSTQAIRYALTSGVGLCLNSAGMYVLSGLEAVPYVWARSVLAVLVSVAWSFPMQRHFVFAHESCFGSPP